PRFRGHDGVRRHDRGDDLELDFHPRSLYAGTQPGAKPQDARRGDQRTRRLTNHTAKALKGSAANGWPVLRTQVVGMAEPAQPTVVNSMSRCRHFLVLAGNRAVCPAEVKIRDYGLRGTRKTQTLHRFSRIFTGR